MARRYLLSNTPKRLMAETNTTAFTRPGTAGILKFEQKPRLAPEDQAFYESVGSRMDLLLRPPRPDTVTRIMAYSKKLRPNP